MLVLVVLDGPEVDEGEAAYLYVRAVEFSAVPRVGEELSFTLGGRTVADLEPFGKVASVSWQEGLPMIWCDGCDVWLNGNDEHAIMAAGWKRTMDPWDNVCLIWHEQMKTSNRTQG